MTIKNAARTSRRIAGIDIGGTFTDLLLYEDGASGPSLKLAKIPTTVANQAEGVLAAIAATGVSPADMSLLLVHLKKGIPRGTSENLGPVQVPSRAETTANADRLQ